MKRRSAPKPATPEYIDVTPTWTGMLPFLMALLADGNASGKQQAREELRRMAQAADRWNDHVRGKVQ